MTEKNKNISLPSCFIYTAEFTITCTFIHTSEVNEYKYFWANVFYKNRENLKRNTISTEKWLKTEW